MDGQTFVVIINMDHKSLKISSPALLHLQNMNIIILILYLDNIIFIILS